MCFVARCGALNVVGVHTEPRQDLCSMLPMVLGPLPVGIALQKPLAVTDFPHDVHERPRPWKAVDPRFRLEAIGVGKGLLLEVANHGAGLRLLADVFHHDHVARGGTLEKQAIVAVRARAGLLCVFFNMSIARLLRYDANASNACTMLWADGLDRLLHSQTTHR